LDEIARHKIERNKIDTNYAKEQHG